MRHEVSMDQRLPSSKKRCGDDDDDDDDDGHIDSYDELCLLV